MRKPKTMLKKLPERYLSRSIIEETVKEKCIDRQRFHEYSKDDYMMVINRFFYAFVEHDNDTEVDLNYCWLHFRKELKVIATIKESIGWDNMLNAIKEKLAFDRSKKLYLILGDGWVYEGFIDEITAVLYEVDGLIDEFYIVSPQFDKLASYCDDGQCMVIIEK